MDHSKEATPSETCTVLISGPSHKQSRGEVQRKVWSKGERTARAIKIFGGCWGLAVVTFFIPLAHFFLVPGFLLAGPIAAYYLFSQDSVILGGKGTCPECQAALPIVRGPDQWPLTELCSSCHKNLTVERAS